MKHTTCNIKNKIHKIVIALTAFVFIVTCYMLQVTRVFALDMSSPRFRLESGKVESPGTIQSQTYDLSTTLNEFDFSEFQANGYVVKSSFTTTPFNFSVSNVSVNFGSLSANLPKTYEITFAVITPENQTYQITASQETPFKALSGDTIPDTACQPKTNFCNKLVAQKWTSNAVFGFGFNILSENSPSDFYNRNYFRPFADSQVNIMAGKKSSQAKMTLKVNIDPSQPIGSYQTIAKFIAAPGY